MHIIYVSYSGIQIKNQNAIKVKLGNDQESPSQKTEVKKTKLSIRYLL